MAECKWPNCEEILYPSGHTAGLLTKKSIYFSIRAIKTKGIFVRGKTRFFVVHINFGIFSPPTTYPNSKPRKHFFLETFSSPGNGSVCCGKKSFAKKSEARQRRSKNKTMKICFSPFFVVKLIMRLTKNCFSRTFVLGCKNKSTFLNGPLPASVCLFSFFSHSNSMTNIQF